MWGGREERRVCQKSKQEKTKKSFKKKVKYIYNLVGSGYTLLVHTRDPNHYHILLGRVEKLAFGVLFHSVQLPTIF